MPQLQCEIFHDRLSAEPDFDVVRAVDGLDLSQAVERTRAEFVIVGAGRFETGEVTVLHETRPAVKVLAVSATGRQGLLYELRPHRVPLGDLSLDGLVDAIRTLRRPAHAPTSDQEHATNGDGR